MSECIFERTDTEPQEKRGRQHYEHRCAACDQAAVWTFHDADRIHRACPAVGPGSRLKRLLHAAGIDVLWMKARRTNSCVPCERRAQRINYFWYTSPLTQPIRLYLRNYSTNIRLLINKLKGT